MVQDVIASLNNELQKLNERIDAGALGGTTVNKTVNNIDTSRPNDENSATYFSSGRDRIIVGNDNSWEDLGFGFIAATINIRVTRAPVEVAFGNPNQNSQGLTVRPDESPFTIGGDPPIGTAFVWLRKADTADEDPQVEILAYR